MGNKPKNVLFNIMTKRHYLAFGHDAEQSDFGFICHKAFYFKKPNDISLYANISRVFCTITNLNQ